MLGRTMSWVAAVATLGMIATALHGWTMAQEQAELRVHLLLALASFLLFLVAVGWIVTYLLQVVPLITDTASRHGLNRVLDPRLDGFRRRVLLPLGLSLLSCLAIFGLGGSAYSGSVPGWAHVVAWVVAISTQIWGLVSAWRTLDASERSIERLKKGLPK